MRDYWLIVGFISSFFFVVVNITYFLDGTSSVGDAVVNESTTDGSGYVAFCSKFIHRFGLCNQLFAFAAAQHVSELSGRTLAVQSDYQLHLLEVFDVGVPQLASKQLCPCRPFSEPMFSGLRYNGDLRRFAEEDARTSPRPARSRSLVLSGFFQSWKYAQSPELRRHLTFRRQYVEFAEKFLAANISRTTCAGLTRVGVHVRRGDFLTAPRHLGFTVATVDYFRRAMRFFVDRFRCVQFIVCSNDWSWTKPRFQQIASELGPTVDVTYSLEHSAGEDLALLAACDHTIVSTGSYGWWAAWLANGTTTYFADYPRNGSRLHEDFVQEDYFPPHWIALT